MNTIQNRAAQPPASTRQRDAQERGKLRSRKGLARLPGSPSIFQHERNRQGSAKGAKGMRQREDDGVQ